jgi:tRNA(fMet)-specific endonuclease VapC
MYLLDTNICIYIIKQKPGHLLSTLKRKSTREIFISAVTVAELEYGIAKSQFPERNKLALIQFLSVFTILHFNDKDAAQYGTIRAALEKTGRIIGPMDLLIAAQAVANQLILVTNNVREFERVEGIKIENWVDHK